MFLKKKDHFSQIEKLIDDFRRTQSPNTLNQMLELFPKVPLYYASWKIEPGPDDFPYLNLNIKGEDENQTTLKDIAEKALSEGFGVTINKSAGKVDWVFSLGDFIPLARIGILVTHSGHIGLQSKRIEKETKVQVGAPNEYIIPITVRKHLRNYLQNNLKFADPKFYLMFNPKDNLPWTIMFNFSRKDFKSETDYKNVLGSLSWFFPKTVFIGCIENDKNQFFEI